MPNLPRNERKDTMMDRRQQRRADESERARQSEADTVHAPELVEIINRKRQSKQQHKQDFKQHR